MNCSLSDIKPGDQVIVKSIIPGVIKSTVQRVYRITPKQIVIDYNLKFWRHDGTQVGKFRLNNRWYKLRVSKVTEDSLKMIDHENEHRKLARKLFNVNWNAEDLERLQVVWEAYCIVHKPDKLEVKKINE